MDLTSAFKVSGAHWSADSGLSILKVVTAKDLRSTTGGLTWLALTVIDPDLARTILRDDFGFHPVAIEDALSDNERPGMYSDDKYVFATIPIVDVRDGENCYTHLGLFVCHDTLVTVTTLGSKFVEEWFTRWKAHPGEIGPRTDMLMQELLDAAVDDFFPVLDRIQADVDELEERVYSGRKPDAAGAIRIRRRLLEMRRQVTPIRDLLNTLLRRDETHLSSKTTHGPTSKTSMTTRYECWRTSISTATS